MAFKVRGVRFFILTSLMATWVWMAPYSKSKKLEILFKQISDCLLFCILDFFRVGCQNNPNLSKISKLVKNIQTCQKYPNLFKLFERVRTIQTCQNYPNVSKLLNVSASFERVGIIWTSQHHVNELSSSECGKLVKY